MNVIEKATILFYHRERISSFGKGSVLSLGWKESESQKRRFQVLKNQWNLNGASILDLGCGYGDLKGYLDRHFSDFHYTGIDLQPEFIEEAERRYGHLPHTHFFQTDFSSVDFPRVDYVFASGALSYQCCNNHFIFEMISKMYLASNRGVLFNLLDNSVFPEHPILAGRDVGKVEAFCRSLCGKVKVIKGYQEGDVSLCMER